MARSNIRVLDLASEAVAGAGTFCCTAWPRVRPIRSGRLMTLIPNRVAAARRCRAATTRSCSPGRRARFSARCSLADLRNEFSAGASKSLPHLRSGKDKDERPLSVRSTWPSPEPAATRRMRGKPTIAVCRLPMSTYHWMSTTPPINSTAPMIRGISSGCSDRPSRPKSSNAIDPSICPVTSRATKNAAPSRGTSRIETAM